MGVQFDKLKSLKQGRRKNIQTFLFDFIVSLWLSFHLVDRIPGSNINVIYVHVSGLSVKT